jgi:hypothetical protein
VRGIGNAAGKWQRDVGVGESDGRIGSVGSAAGARTPRVRHDSRLQRPERCALARPDPLQWVAWALRSQERRRIVPMGPAVSET